MLKKNKYYSKDDALKRLQRYCVYQDRCHQEVIRKLIELRIFGEDQDDIIVELIRENFLNEERFAQSYARGKFRFKRWGKNKILRELKLRKISKYCIKKAMLEIDQDEYDATLRKLILKKMYEYKAPNYYQLKQRAAKFAIMKGYESHLVWDLANSKDLEEEYRNNNG